MRLERLVPIGLISLAGFAGAAVAQVTAPRVDAAAPEVAPNEVDIEAYPDVRLLVTVLSEGQPVSGLAAEDFRVREDEVDQTPLKVDPQLPPLSVVLAVDTSGSMAPAINAAKSAATAFLRTLAAVVPLERRAGVTA